MNNEDKNMNRRRQDGSEQNDGMSGGYDNEHSNNPDRSEFVKNFTLDMKDDKENVVNEQPKYKGEVYFSNPPKNSHIENKKEDGSGDKKKKIKRRTGNIILISLISLLTVASIILSTIAISCMNDILAINRSSEIVTVNIPEHADTNDIIKILSKNGLVKQRLFCDAFIKVISELKKSKTPKYLNGIYYVKSNIGLEAMLNEFKSVQVTAKTVKLVFPEGWSIYQIIDKLNEYKVCKSEYLYAALKETKFNYAFVNKITPNDERTQLLEGYFFPDTYEFFENENANSVIRRFLTNFDEKWTTEYSQRADKLGMSMEEIITIASIIQKEAANVDQMPLVSSVLHNRLERSASFPTLECNSTSDYIKNFAKPVIGDALSSVYIKNYSTYMSQGLPPGPICNPGIEAIEAALYPKDTDYYYFQHDDSGKIYMARNNAEQIQNNIEVLRANEKLK